MEVSRLTSGAGRKRSLGDGRVLYVPTAEKCSHIHLIISVIQFTDGGPGKGLWGRPGRFACKRMLGLRRHYVSRKTDTEIQLTPALLHFAPHLIGLGAPLMRKLLLDPLISC